VGQANLIALHGQHLDEHLVAELQFVPGIADAMLRDFTDVQQAVGTREKLLNLDDNVPFSPR
jgi:hypothetical protein